MSAIKQLLLRGATSQGVAALLKPLMRSHGTIFMLHRFQQADTGSRGLDPSILRRGLDQLRQRRYTLIALEEMFARLGRGEPLAGTVAFTIDDGYLDQAQVAAPLFSEFDCPVTTFLTSGFLDRTLWFWWDRIEYVIERMSGNSIRIELGKRTLTYTWKDHAERRRAQVDFTEHCKRVPNDDKLEAIERLAETTGVSLPEAAPPQYAPMSWDQARACEKSGMTFGPHTVTHPILAQTSDSQAGEEIGESWNRVKAELKRPVPILCYPNGGLEDFGTREIGHARTAGLTGAVVGIPGYAGAQKFNSAPEAPFKVPRFSFPPTVAGVLQCASGLERLKSIVRTR